jgi:hypothetical protein
MPTPIHITIQSTSKNSFIARREEEILISPKTVKSTKERITPIPGILKNILETKRARERGNCA